MGSPQHLGDDELWVEYRDAQLTQGRPSGSLRRGDYLAGVHYADDRMQRFDAFSKIHADLQLVSVNQQARLIQSEAENAKLRAHVFRLLTMIGKDSR